MLTEHTAKYEYNMTLQHWRVTCTCGWCFVGELETCETKFLGHDLQWLTFDRDPEYKKALRIIKGR